MSALTEVLSALASASRRFQVSTGNRTLRTAVGLPGGRPRRTSLPTALDGISQSDQSAMPSAGSWSAKGFPGTRFHTFGSKGSSTQLVELPLRRTRFPGADDPDRVSADLSVDDEEETRFFRERDEDEPVFIGRRFIAKVAAPRIRKPGRCLVECHAVFASIGGSLLWVPFESHVLFL